MLTELKIRNFRKFENYEVGFGPRNLLVGPNNAGKSTLIEGLRLLSIVVNRVSTLNYESPPEWLDHLGLPKGVNPSLRGMDFDLGRETFHQYADPPAKIFGQFDSGAVVEVYVGAGAEVFAVVRDTDGAALTSKAHARRFGAPRLGIQPQVGPLARRERPLRDRYVRGALDSSLAPNHFRNQLRLLKDYFPDFCEVAERTWPGLAINGLELQGLGDELHLELYVRDGSFVSEVAGMGHGLQMWLQLMWFLVRSAESDTIVLDEPDVYMHPDLQRRLVRFILSRSQQTIIATHSVEMMAEVEPDELIVIDADRRAAQHAKSVADVQHVVEQIGGVHNLEFARLAKASKYLVLPPEDLRLLKQWSDLVLHSGGDALDLLPSFPCRGIEDWPYVVAMKRVLESTRTEKLRALCLMPSPGDREAQEHLRSNAGQEGVDLHIWSCPDLAAFLLDPDVIARVIREKSDGDAPSRNDVAAQIEALAPAWDEDRDLSPLLYLRGRPALLKISAWARTEFGCTVRIIDVLRGFASNEVSEEVVAVVEAIGGSGMLQDVQDRVVPRQWVQSSGAGAVVSRDDGIDDLLELLAPPA